MVFGPIRRHLASLRMGRRGRRFRLVRTSAERMARRRARQRAGLEAVPDAPGADEPPGLLAAVEVSVAALGLDGSGLAAAGLARAYARAIDGAADHGYALVRFGPRLLACLIALGATPASRVPGKPPERRPTWLDQMRAGRRAL